MDMDCEIIILRELHQREMFVLIPLVIDDTISKHILKGFNSIL